MEEDWGEKSLEELGANKPSGHEAAGGSVHAHCLFIPLTGIKAMPIWGSEDGQQGPLHSEEGKGVEIRVEGHGLNPFVLKENWAYP